MGLIKSKSPVSGHDDSSTDGTQSLGSRRCRRGRLPRTPSPWTSGELIDSSPENQADFIKALRNKWGEIVGRKMMDQRHSMLKKLVGRLSQKVGTTQQTALHDRNNAGGPISPAGRVISSANPVQAADHRGRLTCYERHDPRTTLSIYRSSLQSCVDTVLVNDNCEIDQQPNQVSLYTGSQ